MSYEEVEVKVQVELTYTIEQDFVEEAYGVASLQELTPAVVASKDRSVGNLLEFAGARLIRSTFTVTPIYYGTGDHEVQSLPFEDGGSLSD